MCKMCKFLPSSPVQSSVQAAATFLSNLFSQINVPPKPTASLSDNLLNLKLFAPRFNNETTDRLPRSNFSCDRHKPCAPSSTPQNARTPAVARDVQPPGREPRRNIPWSICSKPAVTAHQQPSCPVRPSSASHDPRAPPHKFSESSQSSRSSRPMPSPPQKFSAAALISLFHYPQ